MNVSECVLLVDDNPAVLRLMKEVVSREGLVPYCANSASEALQIAGMVGQDLALVVTDMVLPETSGLALARTLLARRPGIHLLVVSGYSPDPDLIAAAELPTLEFLPKPFAPSELAERIRQLLGAGAGPGAAPAGHTAAEPPRQEAAAPTGVTTIQLPREFYVRRRAPEGDLREYMPWKDATDYVTDGCHFGIRFPDGAIHWITHLWGGESGGESGDADREYLLERLHAVVEGHLTLHPEG